MTATWAQSRNDGGNSGAVWFRNQTNRPQDAKPDECSTGRLNQLILLWNATCKAAQLPTKGVPQGDVMLLTGVGCTFSNSQELIPQRHNNRSSLACAKTALAGPYREDKKDCCRVESCGTCPSGSLST